MTDLTTMRVQSELSGDDGYQAAKRRYDELLSAVYAIEHAVLPAISRVGQILDAASAAGVPSEARNSGSLLVESKQAQALYHKAQALQRECAEACDANKAVALGPRHAIYHAHRKENDNESK